MRSLYAASIAYVQRTEFLLVDQALTALELARCAHREQPSPKHAVAVEVARAEFVQAYADLPPMAHRAALPVLLPPTPS